MVAGVFEVADARITIVPAAIGDRLVGGMAVSSWPSHGR
jgi:hypothetical protein